MSRGIRNVWIRGERVTSTARNTKGQDQLMLGKNGGPIIKQNVELVLTPKGQA